MTTAMTDEERELRLLPKELYRKVFSKYPKEQWETVMWVLLARVVARGELPELPEEARQRLIEKYGDVPLPDMRTDPLVDTTETMATPRRHRASTSAPM